MKKLVVVFAVALLFGATACKKTCNCVTKVDGVETMKFEGEVKGKCADLNTKITLDGMTSETTCN